MIKRGLNILIHPLTLSLLIGCIIIYLLPPVFELYKVKLVKYIKDDPRKVTFYYDLDNDGYSEEIWFMEFSPNIPGVIIKTKDKIIKQWNFKGNFMISQPCITGNYNNDEFKEVYVFTYSDDSIYIHGIDPFVNTETPFIEKFIDTYKLRNGLFDGQVFSCDFNDLNSDGFKEIVFAINTGLARRPRKIYVFDIKNKTITTSPKSGTPILKPIAFDLNNNGYNEYTFENSAFENIEEDISFSDNHAWLMVLDRNMQFLFEPVKFGQFKTVIQVNPFRTSKTTYLAVLQKHQGHEDIPNSLFLYDINGKRIREKILGDFVEIEDSWLISRDDTKRNDLYLIHDNGEVEQLDTNLKTINVTKIDDITDGKTIRMDIDLDGVDEFLFGGENMQELILTRNDFSHPVILETPNDLIGGRYYSVIKRRDKSPQLFIQFGANLFIFDYFKNPLYYFKYAVYAGIFAGVYLLMFLIYKVQQIRAQHKYETEKKIAELQLKYVKTQTDPHFTLNIINSLGTLFYKNDPDKANYIFGKYANLLRNTILRSDDISISLSEEIEYVENFLELEKFRLNNKFDYKIQIAENVNQENKVPKMLLHTFVENAIKHGIRHLETKGKLNISLEASNKNYIFIITDNGVGRIKAKKYSKFSTGKGLKILDQILGLYLNLEGIKIKYDIVDLYDNFGDPAGTKVVINVPVKINVSPG